ncbi:hypothetical protein Bca4012_019374 [Brassica carinata]
MFPTEGNTSDESNLYDLTNPGYPNPNADPPLIPNKWNDGSRNGSDDKGAVQDFSGKLFGMESGWVLILKSTEKSYNLLKRD